MIAATQPTLIVADASCVDRFTPTARAARDRQDGPDRRAVARASAHSSREYADGGRRSCDRGDDDMQIIKFSGGSTGTPKPVVQSVRVLDAQARGLLEFFEFDASDVNLIAAPLTHGTSCFVLPILAAGGRHVLLEDPKAAARRSTRSSAYGITTLYAPPTLIYALLGEPSIRGRVHSRGCGTSSTRPRR